MPKNLLHRTWLVIGVVLFSLFLTFPLDKRINLGLDLQGGMHLVLRIDTSKLADNKTKGDAIERALEVIRNRIDEFGVKETLVQMQGEDQIVVQLPGMTDRERVLDIIKRTAMLEFKLVSDDAKLISDALAGNVPEGYELKDSEQGKILVSNTVELTGEYLETADVRFDSDAFGQPMVAMKLKGEGVTKFANVTRNNVGRSLAIILDGKVYSAPRINEAIPSGEAVVSGRFTPDEAKDLAIVLRSGALPAPLVIEEERTVGPLLGQDSIRKGITACVVGFLAIFLFMFFYYGASGLIANAALFLNIVLIMGGMGLFHATLTLPGIAGIILTIGMAVDANVLINERMREELALGKALKTAIANGYDKAFSAIFDANVTTLIAAFFLFQFGTGPIRGFAVTLTIGLVASLFTAIVVTRVIFDHLLLKNKIKALRFKSFIKAETHIDFIGKRWFAYVLSALIFGVGVFAFITKGNSIYGVEFSGGQVQQYLFERVIPIEDLRSSLKEAGMSEASIQQVRENPKEVIIRTNQESAEVVQAEFRKRFSDNKFDILRIEKIGPTVGRDLKEKALKAIIFSLLGILFYVFIRFKHFDFAFGGVFALLHDVILAAGFIIFFGRQLDLLIVTALLTIAGYSINDTIVIYDRVRELMRSKFKLSLKDVINLALNQTLARTILTSFATLMVVVSMYVLGGEILNSFALALLFGFVIGCYSTIFVASPIILMCHTWLKKK